MVVVSVVEVCQCFAPFSTLLTSFEGELVRLGGLVVVERPDGHAGLPVVGEHVGLVTVPLPGLVVEGVGVLDSVAGNRRILG